MMKRVAPGEKTEKVILTGYGVFSGTRRYPELIRLTKNHVAVRFNDGTIDKFSLKHGRRTTPQLGSSGFFLNSTGLELWRSRAAELV